MKKALKIAGIALLSIIILLAAAFSIYWYRNIHWYDKYERPLGQLKPAKSRLRFRNLIDQLRKKRFTS